jgi:hypothetical protein
MVQDDNDDIIHIIRLGFRCIHQNPSEEKQKQGHWSAAAGPKVAAARVAE